MRLRDIRRDRLRSEGGAWWDFETASPISEPHAEHFCVLVAEAQNPRYRDALARIRMRRHHEIASANGKAEAIALDVQVEAIAESILLGWANLHDDDGKTLVPYSREKALALLRDPDLWQLRHFVTDVSGIGFAYQKAAEAEALGN